MLTRSIVVGLILAGSVQAQPAQPEKFSRPTYAIGTTAGPIVIDGVISPAEWSGASPIALQWETSPGDNVAAPVRTEALVAHDSETLYVAFRAWDPQPSAIRANLTDRDSAFQDDFVGIAVDTFNDERRAFEFFVNPLGVQMDLTNYDVDGGNEDDSWDAIWASAGKIHEDRWEVEMAIPFRALRFPAASGAQTWGLDLLRIYPRNQSHRLSVNALDRNKDCYICQFSKLTGFQGIKPGRNIELTPTITAHRTDARATFPHSPIEPGRYDIEPGLTAGWGVTPNLTFNAAINPDFSQVEADSPQLDVNTTFTLFFNEKRPFFLEGADFFQTPLQAVYTRTISDPTWGAKLTGKEGKSGGGAFVAGDSVTNVLLPGAEGSRQISMGASNLSGVVRYRYDLGKNSTVGVLLTNRTGDDYANHVGGLDGFFRLTDKDSISAQVLTSRTRYPDSVAARYEQPAESFHDFAGVIRYRHSERNWFWKASYDEVGPDFRADAGFMPRVDYRYGDAGIQRTWYGDGKHWYNRLFWGGDWDRTEDHGGFLLEEEFRTRFGFAGPRQSFVIFNVGRRDRSYLRHEFRDQHFVSIRAEITPHKRLYADLNINAGDTIDFANIREATRLRIAPFLRYRATRSLLLEVSHQWERLDVEGGRLFTATATQFRTVYQFNIRTFLRAILQHTDVDRDPSLYNSRVDASSQRLFPQLLFSYKLNPQTVLFIGYSSTRLANDESIDLLENDRTVFVKIGYAWLL